MSYNFRMVIGDWSQTEAGQRLDRGWTKAGERSERGWREVGEKFEYRGILQSDG